MRVAAIGPGTARALRARGIEADVVPERAVAEGLVEALARRAGRARPDRRRGRGPRRPAPTRCARAAPTVDEVALYETVAEPLDDAARAAATGADYLLFASGSAVRFFARAAGDGAFDGPRIASIGPATSAELREHGREPDLEADPHTPDGLVAALLEDAAR